MKIIDAKQCTAIALGRLGENDYTVVRFDVSAWLNELPGAVIGLYNQRPGDGAAYPVAGITVEGGIGTWTVTSAELTQTGEGKCELVAIAGEVVAKSAIFRTMVFDALNGSGEAPEPWEEWQQQLIILKNEAEQAADRAEEAVEHYPRIVDGIWKVWDAQAGAYVSTGISATGPQGERGETGSQGPRGETGATGAAGADGFSPVATVTQTASGATISITDKQGTTTANISNGQDGSPGQPGTDGTDGVSPTVTVTDITGGHRITITDATGAHSFDVMDGQDGQGAVQDVQVNGTSVVTDGVANVPMATKPLLPNQPGSYGVMRVGSLGVTLYDDVLCMDTPTDAMLKNGTTRDRAVTVYCQDRAAFYGLAKAAGSDEKNSTLPVGQYTDAAKIAIQKMLGIYEAPWELIREDTFTNATEADHIITVDGNGEPFELTDVYIELWLPEQATEATVGKNGRIDYYYDASQYFTTYHGTKTQSANGYPNGTFALLKNDNGATLAVYANYNTMGTDRVTVAARGRTNGQKSLLIVGDYTFNKLHIYAITGTAQYRLYGKRKWQ